LPVWVGGGRLAADLTWPKLAARWPGATGGNATSVGQGVSRQDRSRLWCLASDAAARAAVDLRRLAVTDLAAGSDLAYATADLLPVMRRDRTSALLDCGVARTMPPPVIAAGESRRDRHRTVGTGMIVSEPTVRS
jgi:hypothetical protein